MRGANVYPLEYFGAPLLAEMFPLGANEKSFLEFTGTSDPKVSKQYLDMTEGNLEVAVATYVDQELPCLPPSVVRDAIASLFSVEDLDSNSNEFASSPRDDAIMLWEKESDDEERFLGITGTSDIDVAIRFLEMANGDLVTVVNIWRGVPCASLSLDENDSNQKLPAARPAILSMAAVSSSTRDADIDTDINDDDDDDDDNDIDTDINDDDDDDDDDDGVGGLNDINGISELELKRMRNVARNNARLASLGLLGRTPSTATPLSDRPNRKKRVVPQDDVERRVQPKRNAKKPTSYRDLDDHVIIKRTQPIDSPDTGEEDTVHKRMFEDEAEYSPSGSNDEEECNEDKDELETPTAAITDRLHHDDRQYQSVEFYNAEKRLIDRYEEVSGGVKADISPDPLPLPQEMKKQKNNYESWFAGHYPSPLQDGKSYTEKDGRATAFTTRMYENAVNSGLPPDKQLVLGQMFDYFTDCTLGQVPFLADGENYCHNKHYLKVDSQTMLQGSIGGIFGSMSSAASSLMRST